MKDKDRSLGGQQDQQGRNIGNQQKTTQTGGMNNGGQSQDINRRERQGEGSHPKTQSRPEGGSRGSSNDTGIL